jgi:translation initiation factor 2 subunit 1
LNIDPQIKADILMYIKRKLAPQPVKIRSDIEVTCFTYEGIDAIKESLLMGERVGTKDSAIKIKLIAPPMYVMTCMTLDKDFGINLLNQATEVIGESIRSKG